MTPAEAAAIYLDYQPIADVITGPLDRAKKVLREHLADPKRTTYKGIGISTGGGTRFNQAKAKELLGAKAEQCMVFTPSSTLVLPARLRKGAVELSFTLKPVTAEVSEVEQVAAQA